MRQAVGPAADVRVSDSVADDLRRSPTRPRAGAGQVLVTAGDIVTHREALAGLLADPHAGTRHPRAAAGGARSPSASRPGAGRLISAASAYHAVRRPNGTVPRRPAQRRRRRRALAAAAEGLAPLVADVPGDWPPGARAQGRALAHRVRARRRRAEGGDDDAGPDEPERHRRTPRGGRPRRVVLSDDEETRSGARASPPRPRTPSALLVVGLVRAERRVAPVYLRSLFWARPLSAEAAARAAERSADHDEDRVLLDSAVKATDGFFTTFFVSPYSKYVARWAARRGSRPTRSPPSRCCSACWRRPPSPPASAGASSPAPCCCRCLHHRLRRRPARPLHAALLQARRVAGLGLRPRQGVPGVRRPGDRRRATSAPLGARRAPR